MANESEWNAKAKKLVGRRIVTARYMTKAEADLQGWQQRPIVLQLDDGTVLFPSSDDEGNDAGALFMQKGENTDDGFPCLFP